MTLDHRIRPSSREDGGVPDHAHPSPDSLIATVRSSVIGASETIDGPFGRRPVIYADYTASGRALTFIEDYLRDAVLPLYANTHTESSQTGRHTTMLREEARALVAAGVGATDEHAVLFCGSGATGAIDKLVGVLGLRVPCTLDDRYHFTEQIPCEQRPVVFIGPYEHHSNELPWRESIADVVTIDEDSDGHVDLAHLHRELERYADRPLLIGSFSAASNVTGILTDVASIATMLHEFGALSFWDYAAAAPYVQIEMSSAAEGNLAYLDAVFISPHKMVGGPGTPGVLVARRELFANRVPDVPGGGTVRFVAAETHEYLPDIEAREEGGTPAIVDSIRAGLVFQLRDAVGVDTIRDHEERFARAAIESWETNPAIDVLGSHDVDRLSIVSFIVRHGDRALHHNFVVAVLNDVFGIQSRGGCSCAGPYGHRLLAIEPDESARFQREIARGSEGIKPGWARVNFNYFFDRETFDYIVDAVHLVATSGWRMLPWYTFDPSSGLWRHRDAVDGGVDGLHAVDYSSGAMAYPPVRHERGAPLTEYLDAAREVLDAEPPPAIEPVPTSADFEALRWFAYPTDV